MESLQVQFHQRLSASGMPAVIQQGVLAHWQQFADRHPACTDQPVKAEAVDELIRCWAGSDFVAEQCLNHPQWLTSLLTNHEHLAMLAHNHVERLHDALAAIATRRWCGLSGLTSTAGSPCLKPRQTSRPWPMPASMLL